MTMITIIIYDFLPELISWFKKKNLFIYYLLFFWFGLVSLFNGISTFVRYLMPKPFS